MGFISINRSVISTHLDFKIHKKSWQGVKRHYFYNICTYFGHFSHPGSSWLNGLWGIPAQCLGVPAVVGEVFKHFITFLVTYLTRFHIKIFVFSVKFACIAQEVSVCVCGMCATPLFKVLSFVFQFKWVWAKLGQQNLLIKGNICLHCVL